MKRILVVLSFLLVAGMLFGSGCGTTNQASPLANSLQNYNITGTLQGKIMDAVTGAPIGGSDLKVYLIQGTSNRGPNTLITDPRNPLVGNYAFSGIPAVLNDSTGLAEAKFRVVVSKPGYQPFEGDVSLIAYDLPNFPYVVNSVINKIGDIYLYPLGSSAGDLSVYVYDPNGLPIPNTNVLLKQNVTNNNIIANTSTGGDRLVAMAGLYPELNATTNAAGLATFTGGTLTLGGSYNAVVSAMTFNGEQLATTASGSFIIGTSSTTQYVNMTLIGNTLYAISASNSVPGTITASGVLTITFNQPVIMNTMTFGVTLNAGTGGSGTFGGVTTITGVLSNNNTTLTLTPPTITGTLGTGAYIAYSFVGGFIGLQIPQGGVVPYTLFGVGNPVQNITTGAAVSGMVQLTSY